MPSNSVQSMVMEDGEWKFGPDIPLVVTLPKVATIAETLYMLDVEESRKLLHLNVDEHVWKELAPMPVEECYGVGMTHPTGPSICCRRGKNDLCFLQPCHKHMVHRPKALSLAPVWSSYLSQRKTSSTRRTL